MSIAAICIARAKLAAAEEARARAIQGSIDAARNDAWTDANRREQARAESDLLEAKADLTAALIARGITEAARGAQ